MSHFQTFTQLAAYLVCIGIALEISHRYYWQTNDWIASLDLSVVLKTALNTMLAFVPLATAVVVTAAFVHLVDHQSMLILGLSYDGDSLTKVAHGALIALGCITFAFFLGLLFGYIEVSRSQASDDCISCIPTFMGGLVSLFSAAVFEEIIFRGYVYHMALQKWGLWPAVIVSALAFSLFHMIKRPHTPHIFKLNVLVFGIIMALARHLTGSLWLPIGLHFGWNVASGPILGLPSSGRTNDRGVVISNITGPSWLTGGLYSFDAGLLGTLALLVASIGLSAVAPIY